MNDINWQAFKSKFYQKEHIAFENLSYLLFCYEHGLSNGLFRYKNQTGIETNPIEVANDVIGFQSKFYDTKLSENKDDLTTAIKKAKLKHPNLTIIKFYLNQEFSESSKSDKLTSVFQDEVEKLGKDIGVSIQWRVPSHIEVIIAHPDNTHLAQHFFGTGKSTMDFLDALSIHTSNLLYPIQNEIAYQEKKIVINRDVELKLLNNELRKDRITIVSGDGGAGKTALIKAWQKERSANTPIYVFKAAEFKVTDINELFLRFGNYNLIDFIALHADQETKFFIIDSAEKLADLSDQDPFVELLTSLIKAGWHIIFTTRNNYLEDLKFAFIEIYRLAFSIIKIEILNKEQLNELSQTHSFPLPSDMRFQTLLCNPFYLNEYLQSLEPEDEIKGVEMFKNILWQKKILNSRVRTGNLHLLRERTFLDIVKTRTETGRFYVLAEGIEVKGLEQLAADDILLYDSTNNGYYITHDIYEEWALERIIEQAYSIAVDDVGFLKNIGKSLPIRRAFRNWLSSKITSGDNAVPKLIHSIFFQPVEDIWKDEILVALLLSEDGASFIHNAKSQLLLNNRQLLLRICFLLRTACKEIESRSSNKEDRDSVREFIFTVPRGRGWQGIISLIHETIHDLDESQSDLVVSVASDWIHAHSKGETTRSAGLALLAIYERTIIDDEFYFSKHKDLIRGILGAAAEIRQELTVIITKITSDVTGKVARDYDALCDGLLIDTFHNTLALMALPGSTISLADFLWWDRQNKKNHYYEGLGIEQYYGLASDVHHDFSPASAYQTPLFWLLMASFKEALDFIIEFTSKAVERFAQSKYGSDVIKVTLFSKGEPIGEQLISGCIWSMYRGTGSPVTPYLLQSMHMALEKYLLAVSKDDKRTEELEHRLLYILKKTRSASLTAVVASIVLANPDKFFAVAKILFGTAEFYYKDSVRLGEEDYAKNLYAIGRGLDYKTKHFEDERMETCDHKHRKLCLEHLAVNYQFFRNEGISSEESEARIQMMYQITDDLKAKLLNKELNEDQKRKLAHLVGRMDRRNINLDIEETENGFKIALNPLLSEELKADKEQASHEFNEKTKFIPLGLWARYKFEPSRDSGSFSYYDNDIGRVIKETKEIIDQLNDADNHNFYLSNYSIPAFACSAIVRFYPDKVSEEDLLLCRDIIVSSASAPLSGNYWYQIGDGVEAAINALPHLYNIFPNERETFNGILLFILFDQTPIGEYKRVCTYASETLDKCLWNKSPEDAKQIIAAFILMKQKYDERLSATRLRNGFVAPEGRRKILMDLAAEENEEIDKIFAGFGDFNIVATTEVSLETFEIVFACFPKETVDPLFTGIVKRMLPQITALTQSAKRSVNTGEPYRLRHSIFKRYAGFLLSRPILEVGKFIKPFADVFTITEETAELLDEIVSAEDELNSYEQFWLVWEYLYDSFKSAIMKGSGYRTSIQVAHSYLLAWRWWKVTAREWRSLKDREKLFFARVSHELNSCPEVLSAVAQFLNQIGSSFLNDGIFWIGDIITKLSEVDKLETSGNTIYYSELLVRRYAYLNRTKLRTSPREKANFINILNFLVINGSTKAYLLREDYV